MSQPTTTSATPPSSNTMSSNPATPVPLDTFHPFQRLPVELRVKIWKIASHEPRAVQVRFAQSCRILKHDFVADIPAVLHTSNEARQEALKYYKVLIQNRLSLNTTYFNYTADILCINTHNFDQAKSFIQKFPAKKLVQRLAVPNALVAYFSVLKANEPGAKPVVFQFTGLKELFILKLFFCVSGQACSICHLPLGSQNRDLFMSGEQVVMHGRKAIGDGNTYGQFDILQHEKQAVAVFRNHLKNETWGAVKWEEPIIIIGGVYPDTIFAENKYCNPYGRNYHATRSSKRLA